MTLHQAANFRVKHLNSDIEQTRRGIILLITSITIYRDYINTPIKFLSEKHSKQTGFWCQNSDILISPQMAIFELFQVVVRKTFTSESTGFKSRLPISFRVAVKLNLTCLI